MKHNISSEHYAYSGEKFLNMPLKLQIKLWRFFNLHDTEKIDFRLQSFFRKIQILVQSGNARIEHGVRSFQLLVYFVCVYKDFREKTPMWFFNISSKTM